MTLAKQIAASARRMNRDAELPDFLLPDILEAVAGTPRSPDRKRLLSRLLEQVEGYETFSEVSCEKSGFSLEDIRKTLKLLRDTA